jgi:hypothetical protein
VNDHLETRDLASLRQDLVSFPARLLQVLADGHMIAKIAEVRRRHADDADLRR